MNLKNRIQKLRQKFTENEIDGIVISQPENMYYLSGFDGSYGYLLITDQNTFLATDFRYIEQAKSQAPDYQISQITNGMADWLPVLVSDLGLRKLGFESRHVTYFRYRCLANALKTVQLQLIPLDGLVESLRAIKEPEEIEFIAKAAVITDNAFQYAEETIRPGLTETELSWLIEKFLREQGSEDIPFHVIVASGPNAALPHAKPTSRKINAGDPIIIDMGAKRSGYASDMTRTLYLGLPDDEFRKIYDIVLGAQLSALAIIREGMLGEQADSIARTIIQEAGYGAAFGHSLGHGLGLETHELPRLGPKSNDILTAGMVFTVEPGIYINGWGGVRIEDVVIMEKDELRVISKTKKVRE